MIGALSSPYLIGPLAVVCSLALLALMVVDASGRFTGGGLVIVIARYAVYVLTIVLAAFVLIRFLHLAH